MTLLAFDTSTPSTVVGLRESGGALEEAADRRPWGARPGHQKHLLALTYGLLERRGISFRDLARIAVGVGPGTFTGLRVGVATARALAEAVGAELVPLPSLAVLAYGYQLEGGNGTVLVLADARRGELFGAVYRLGRGGALPEEVVEPRAVGAAGVSDLIAQAKELAAEGLRALGDGVAGLAETLEGEGIALAPERFSQLRGKALAQYGWLASPLFPRAVKPYYGRPPDARERPPRAAPKLEAAP